jgi:hypothetical protein
LSKHSVTDWKTISSPGYVCCLPGTTLVTFHFKKAPRSWCSACWNATCFSLSLSFFLALLVWEQL